MAKEYNQFSIFFENKHERDRVWSNIKNKDDVDLLFESCKKTITFVSEQKYVERENIIEIRVALSRVELALKKCNSSNFSISKKPPIELQYEDSDMELLILKFNEYIEKYQHLNLKYHA